MLVLISYAFLTYYYLYLSSAQDGQILWKNFMIDLLVYDGDFTVIYDSASVQDILAVP